MAFVSTMEEEGRGSFVCWSNEKGVPISSCLVRSAPNRSHPNEWRKSEVRSGIVGRQPRSRKVDSLGGVVGAPGSKQKTEPYFLRPVNRRPDDLHPGIMYIREECVVSKEIDVEPTIFLQFFPKDTALNKNRGWERAVPSVTLTT